MQRADNWGNCWVVPNVYYRKHILISEGFCRCLWFFSVSSWIISKNIISKNAEVVETFVFFSISILQLNYFCSIFFQMQNRPYCTVQKKLMLFDMLKVNTIFVDNMRNKDFKSQMCERFWHGKGIFPNLSHSNCKLRSSNYWIIKQS